METPKASARRTTASADGVIRPFLVAADLGGVSADLVGQLALGPGVFFAQLTDAVAQGHDGASGLDPAAASPAPAAADEPVPEVTGREVVLAFGERRWRVRGLDKASSLDMLRANVMASYPVPVAVPGSTSTRSTCTPRAPGRCSSRPRAPSWTAAQAPQDVQ